MPALEAVICPVCHGIGEGCKKCKGKGWLPLIGVKCPICHKHRVSAGTPACAHIHFGEEKE